MGHYHTAQICRNGHVITSRSDPQFRRDFCSICGSPTITNCEKCRAEIRGYYEIEGFASFSSYEPPGFCASCGQPYPWTEAGLQAAHQLADELEELSVEERTILKESIDDIVRETPRSELGSSRLKRILKKVGKESYDSLKKIVIDLASETVKKAVFGEKVH